MGQKKASKASEDMVASATCRKEKKNSPAVSRTQLDGFYKSAREEKETKIQPIAFIVQGSSETRVSYVHVHE
jgi:hypothetical protein